MGMLVLRSLEEAAAAGRCGAGPWPSGNMDGVHLGPPPADRAGAGARPRRSRRADLRAAPGAGCSGPSSRRRCSRRWPRKLELLAGLGVQATVVQPFDRAYAATPAAVFVARDLGDRLGVANVVVGQDFTAGHERARVDALRPLLAARGIALHLVEPVTADGLVVSSTKIREFLLEGNVEAAADAPGRPYDVDGQVVRGAGRGRGLRLRHRQRAHRPSSSPPTGCTWSAPGSATAGALAEGEEYPGVCNVGVKPTVEAAGGVIGRGAPPRLRRAGPLRQRPPRAFLRRLRDERRFPSVEALRAQIARDVAAARGSSWRG